MARPLEPEATVAVIGAGTMGAGIAQVAAVAGHRVVLFDTRMNAVDGAKKAIEGSLQQLVARGRLAAPDADAACRRIEPIHAVGDCASARLVVEAIVEDLEVKRDLFRQLEVVVSPQAILATNTSSIPITALANGLKQPGRVVGMHFFNPAPVMALVEVVSGLATDAEVAATVAETAAAWGKVPVHAGSTPGFIVNRCARPYYAESLRLLAERAADVATIDAVMREAGGFRMGPFELMDLIGHDVNYAVTESVWNAYYHDSRFTPSLLQRELVLAGYLGRKAGRGFYDYGKDAVRPGPATEAAQPKPEAVAFEGDEGPMRALLERMRAAGIEVRAPADDDEGTVPTLALCDGRTATVRAAETGERALVVVDLAFDYAACTRVAVARSDDCPDDAYAAAVGALQAAGCAVSALDDVSALPVARTLAMLANEAADAVQQGVATAADVDLAMQKGVSYPRGPLAWADAVGLPHVATVLHNLARHYGEDRYRTSPLLARRRASGRALAGPTGQELHDG